MFSCWPAFPGRGRLISSILLLVSSSLIGACSDTARVEGPEEFVSRDVDAVADATLHEILRQPGVLERAERVAQYLKRAEPEELDSIVHEFRIAPLDQGDIEYALFASWWAEFAPAAALAFAENELRMEQPRVIAQVLRTWASTDPEGLREAGGFGQASRQMVWFRAEMADAVVVGWFESGKPGLEDFIFGLTDDETLNTALRAWVRMKVLTEGGEAALEWVEGTTYHADVKRELLIGALVTIAHQDPQLCIAQFERAKEMGIDVGTFVPRIANSWAHHDAVAALAWVLSFPEESVERFRAVQRIANRWRRRDPWGMFDWLESQDDSLDPKLIALLRYTALPALIQASEYRPDWRLLMDRAGTIEDENRRHQTTLVVLQRWYVADEAGARAWIEENPFGMPALLLDRAPLLETKERETIVRVLGLERAAEDESPTS
jgi:hypothetical protein